MNTRKEKPAVPSTAFKDATERIEKKARDLFRAAQDNGVMMPMFVIAVNEDYTRYKSALVQFKDGKEKSHAMVAFVRKLVEQNFSLGSLFFAAESWGTKAKPGTKLEDRLMPSQDPDRFEMMTVAGLNRKENISVAVCLGISRDKDEYGTLVPESDMGDGKAEYMDVLDKNDPDYIAGILDRTFNMYDFVIAAEPYISKGMKFDDAVAELKKKGIPTDKEDILP